MIHINFFIKKKKNILPFLVALIFLAAAALIVYYHYDNYNYYNQLIKSNNTWLSEHEDEFELAKQIRQYDQLIIQAVSVQEDLRLKQYPMDILTENLATFIPQEKSRVSSIHLSDATTQVSLIIENTSADEALRIVEAMEAQAYIESVELISAISQIEEEQLRFEIIIDLDLSQLEVRK